MGAWAFPNGGVPEREPLLCVMAGEVTFGKVCRIVGGAMVGLDEGLGILGWW